MANSDQTHLEKIYVKVSATVDKTGYMRPESIVWEDGRTLRIQEIRDFRPASALNHEASDCYVILVGGQEKHLFFERMSLFPGHFGRWYVVSSAPYAQDPA